MLLTVQIVSNVVFECNKMQLLLQIQHTIDGRSSFTSYPKLHFVPSTQKYISLRVMFCQNTLTLSFVREVCDPERNVKMASSLPPILWLHSLQNHLFT